MFAGPRHSHAALLIAEGIHPKVLPVRLGHASITTTLDTYGHLLNGLDGKAAAALQAGRLRATDSHTGHIRQNGRLESKE